MAFADDIVLLADSIEGAQDHVDEVGRYMIFKPRKSSSFVITSMRNTWVVRDPGFSVVETMLPGFKTLLCTELYWRKLHSH